MNAIWKDHLANAGATLENDRVVHFGQPQQELEAARSGTVLADLSHRGVIGAVGEDSLTFLQGQTTNDIRQVTDRAQYNSLCTPKGRMLASLLVWRSEEGYGLQLPAELLPAIQKRLAMYVLRSKVKIRDASYETVRFGVAGVDAEKRVQALIGSVPQQEMGMIGIDGKQVIRLGAASFEIVAPADQGPALWDALAKDCTPVGNACWEWLEIRAGIPVILPPTQEQFTPQMANFEVIGGVSFTKGCFTGQEVVARTQHLGKVKRRLFLAHLDSDKAPQPGDGLNAGDQAAGMVVNACPAPGGGFDLLAVMPTEIAESQEVRWLFPDGPVLKLQPLPYNMPT